MRRLPLAPPLKWIFFCFFSRDAATLYERVSVRPSVRPSVRWSVRNAFVFWPTRSDECRVYGPFTCLDIIYGRSKKAQIEQGRLYGISRS